MSDDDRRDQLLRRDVSQAGLIIVPLAPTQPREGGGDGLVDAILETDLPDEGFEGGLTGLSGESGFSAVGTTGPSSSSATDPGPTGEPLDLEGALVVHAPEGIVGAIAEGVEAIHHVVETVTGHLTGPILTIPEHGLHQLAHPEEVDPHDGS